MNSSTDQTTNQIMDQTKAQTKPNVSFKNAPGEWIKGQIKSTWQVLLWVLVIHSSLLQAFKIPSGSMIPTLFIGDRIFVNKVSYALKVPFTDLFNHRPYYFFQTGEPARGDVIVFKYPVDPNVYFVKRVIGLPGDTVEMKNKVVFVNGKPMDQKAETLDEKTNETIESQGNTSGLKAYSQHYDHTDGTILIDDQNTHSVNFGPVKVPPGNYFCMGDNRDNSSDSRFWKFVPYQNIEGKAFLIWFSTSLSHLGNLFH